MSKPDVYNEANIGYEQRFDSGMFDPAAREAAHNSDIGREIAATNRQVEHELEVEDRIHRLPIYAVLNYEGKDYIKTPTGNMMELAYYVQRLEKALVLHTRSIDKYKQHVAMLEKKLVSRLPRKAKKEVKKRERLLKEKERALLNLV